MQNNKREAYTKTILPTRKRKLASSFSKVAKNPSKKRMIKANPPPIAIRTAPLRILMVIDQFNIGGTETHTLSLTRELIKKGAVIIIAGKKGKFLDFFLGLGCPYYEIDFVLDNHEPDVENEANYLELLKSIITLERVDLIHCHQIPSGKVAVTAAEQMNVPFVFTVHGAYYDSDFIQILRRGSNIICVSPSIQRLLLTNAIESSLIPNGLDVLEYQPRHSFYREYLRNKLAIPKHAFVVMYAGRLSWEKADICEDIIHLASVLRLNECPNLHLIIAGGGKKQENIIKLAEKQQQQMGTPFIHCVGELTDMCAYYCISDCIIGTGRIALEAMACGRPLIAVGTRGFLGFVQPELYEKAWDCWFGDHDSPEPLSRDELAHHIKSLLYLDPKKKSEMALAGRNFIINRFHISRTTENLIDLYQRVTMSKTKTNSK